MTVWCKMLLIILDDSILSPFLLCGYNEILSYSRKRAGKEHLKKESWFRPTGRILPCLSLLYAVLALIHLQHF